MLAEIPSRVRSDAASPSSRTTAFGRPGSSHYSTAESANTNNWVSPEASSLRTAPSPSISNRPPLSPGGELPALPKFRYSGDAASSVSSPPPRSAYHPTDVSVGASAYYTAAWGSPYATPSPTRPSRSTDRRSRTRNSFGDSSPVLMKGTRRSTSAAPTEQSSTFLSAAESTSGRRPSGTFGRGRALFSTRPGTIRTFTEDWIRQHISGDSARSERNNWLSDDSNDNESDTASFVTGIRSKANSTGGEGWLDLEDRNEDLLKTPTLATFLSRKERGRSRDSQKSGLVPKHASRESVDTLKASDFWDALEPPSKAKKTVSKMSEESMPIMTAPLPIESQEPTNGEGNVSPVNEIPPMEKPLPPPPVERSTSEAPIEKEALEERPPLPPKRPTFINTASFSRPRKKIVWKNKACYIAMPLEDNRHEGLDGTGLLQPEEREARLKAWEEQGYDVRGFDLIEDHSSDYLAEAEGRSRPIFPDVSDLKEEREGKSLRVSIPDKAVWDAYVNHLNEEKLRALGVSFGDEDEVDDYMPSATPLSAMPRTASGMQYPGLPMSPPLPTSSAASNHLLQNANPFSPSFGQSTNPSSHVGSTASPFPGIHGGFHHSSQSIAFSPHDNVPSPFNLSQFQSSTPHNGTFTPQGNYFAQRQRGFSVSPNPQGMPNVSSILSPISPVHEDSNSIPPSNANNLLAQMRAQQQQLQAQMLQQQQQQQHEQLNPFQLHQADEDDVAAREFGNKTPPPTKQDLNIVHPTPKHGKNVSHSLQREVDNAEYHLEDSIRRQLERDDEQEHDLPAPENLYQSPWHDYPDTGSRTTSMPFGVGQFEMPQPFVPSHMHQDVQHHQQHHHQEASDIDTNPSLTGTPPQQRLARWGAEPEIKIPWHEPRHEPFQEFTPGETFKPRSSLNVEAREFKFDPTSSFTPSNFTPGASGNFEPFQSNASPFNSQPFEPAGLPHSSSQPFEPAGLPHSSSQPFEPAGLPHSTSQTSQPSGIPHSSSGNRFNIAAPSFTPSFAESATSHGGGFSFSAPAPAPAADAPGLTPFAPATAPAFVAGGPPKIFGDFDISKIISKPPKKSKAVPIVRPDESEDDGTDKQGDGLQENDEGRLEPADSRSKRARRSGTAEDGLPEFITPTLPLAETAQARSPKRQTAQLPSDGKENSVPAGEVDAEGEEVSISEEQEPFAVIGGKPVILAETPDKERSEDVQDVISGLEESAASVPASPQSLGKRSRVEDEEETVEEIDDSLLDDGPGPALEDDVEVEESEKEEGKPEPKPASNHSKKSSLSATAAPFEYNFLRTTPAAGRIVSAPLAGRPVETPKTRGLASSRWATLSDSDDNVPAKSKTPQPPHLETPARIPTPPSMFKAVPVDLVLGSQREGEEPTPEEIDEVMRQFNEDSDAGIDRARTPSKTYKAPLAPVSDELPPVPKLRSAAPSPVRSVHGTVEDGNISDQSTDIQSQVRRAISPPIQYGTHVGAAINRLNHAEEAEISDWDDVISSGEEDKLHDRSLFFDSHVHGIIGTLLEDHMAPVERSIEMMQHSLALLETRGSSRRPRSLGPVEHSDADDEDDDEEEVVKYRSRSPSKKDLRLEKIRTTVLEAMAVHQISTQQEVNSHASDLTLVLDALTEMKKTVEENNANKTNAAELKTVVEEVIATHPRLRGQRVAASNGEDSPDRLKLQIAGLESMIRIADERTENEYKSRREAQDALAEAQRELQLARDEASQNREAADQAERALQEFHEENVPNMVEVQKRADELEKQEEGFRLTLSELTEKNIALQGTLDEYRVSSDNWRDEIEEFRTENGELRKTMGSLKTELEDMMGSRQTVKTKFEKLQEEMVKLVSDVARDQASWRARQEEDRAKFDSLRLAFDREVAYREKLELENNELQKQEKEAMKLKFVFGQSQQENARLEDLVAKLREESTEHQNQAARFERDFIDARESGRVEVQRTRSAMEADIEAANNQVNYVRAEMDLEIQRLQNQLDSVRMDADTAKARHELILEEMNDAKVNALAEAAQSKEKALKDERMLHERLLNDLRERHARALHNSSEDKQRNESNLHERIALRDEKIEHLHEKIQHLEEKLEVAKSAARAAAEAAQSAKAARPVFQEQEAASYVPARSTGVPEKISPQALRESIMVLQDQLQERERSIEKLEQELAAVDKEAPQKVKDRDTEINWLRELLGVRVDELQDIVTALSRPNFNREAVKDAAIRLRSNIQMEQQMRDRAMTQGGAGGLVGNLASLSSITASPRALPLAAAAAWGNWRKARDSTPDSDAQSTPSKLTSASQSFLSGLLTPPSTNNRFQSQLTNSAPPPRPGRTVATASTQQSRPLRSATGSRPLQSASAARPLLQHVRKESSSSTTATQNKGKGPSFMDDSPSTPPLMHSDSYDNDAAEASSAIQSLDFNRLTAGLDEAVFEEDEDDGDAMEFTEETQELGRREIEETEEYGADEGSADETGPFGPRLSN